MPRDIVLFDRLGNFLGPISEVTGELSNQRYVIRMEEDSVSRMKRKLFKIGDYVYYYNCDRIHQEQEDLNRELNLIELKRQNRLLGNKKPGKIGTAIMKGVIQNLKDLRLDTNSKAGDEMMEEDERNSSKNSRTIISMVMKSHCNTSLVGSAKERQKRKKYKKAKARMFLNQLNELQGESAKKKSKTDIEDELVLGKRVPPSVNNRKDRPEISIGRSSDYSRKSTDTDKRIIPEDDFFFNSLTMAEEMMAIPTEFSSEYNPKKMISEMNEESCQSTSNVIGRNFSQQ